MNASGIGMEIAFGISISMSSERGARPSAPEARQRGGPSQRLAAV